MYPIVFCVSDRIYGEGILSTFAKVLILARTERLGRKETTLRGAIGTRSPVFGLRPSRARLLRTWNLPKEEIFASPCWTRKSARMSMMSSIKSLLSRRENPSFACATVVKEPRVTVRLVAADFSPMPLRRSCLCSVGLSEIEV